MIDSGESRKEVIRPDFNRAIRIDSQGATITSDVGFLLLREINDRFKIIASQMTSGVRGIDLLEIWGNLTLRPNLCYFATCEKNWPREEDRLGDFARTKEAPKPRWTETATYAA